MRDAISRSALFVALLWLVFSVGGPAYADVIVSGHVYDAATDSALADVHVSVEEAEEDISPALTSKSGKYTLVIPDRTEARLTFAKEGYEAQTTLLKLTDPKVKHDVRLELVSILIEMTKFKSGSYIKGEVRGLDPGEYGKRKLLVYILTDKWYVHPYAENKAGRGFAAIDSTGAWKIDTQWRGYQAYKVAFLLVPKDTYVAPEIDLMKGKQPEVALLNVVDPEAYQIIDAPEGI
jgi:hypothetical protein